MQALSFAAHIPLVCFGIALPAMILFVEWLYLRSGDDLYRVLARRWTTFGFLTAPDTSFARRSMISFGVPAGAIRPVHRSVLNPGNPDSAKVGTFGIRAARVSLDTASGRSAPLVTCGSTAVVEWNGRRDGYRLKGRNRMRPGDRLVLRYPGGGGYGDPRERPAELVRADASAGFVSAAAADESYGRVVE